MKLIVGLGNPGHEYAATRHNVGFMALDMLAKKLDLEFSKTKHASLVAEGHYQGEKIMLLKPQTYMNKSGEAVIDAANFYNLEDESILVLFDDMDLPCGLVRARQKGSPGGHRGMDSIITHLGSNAISRLKIGIDHPMFGAVTDYVLMPFNSSEQELILPALETAAEAAICWLENDIKTVMNEYNGLGKTDK